MRRRGGGGRERGGGAGDSSALVCSSRKQARMYAQDGESAVSMAARLEALWLVLHLGTGVGGGEQHPILGFMLCCRASTVAGPACMCRGGAYK